MNKMKRTEEVGIEITYNIVYSRLKIKKKEEEEESVFAQEKFEISFVSQLYVNVFFLQCIVYLHRYTSFLLTYIIYYHYNINNSFYIEVA